MNNEIVKEVVGQAEGVLTEVYKDTLQPALQPVGQIISYPTRILRLAFSPIEKWLVGAETSLRMAAESVNKKIEDIPEDKIVPLTLMLRFLPLCSWVIVRIVKNWEIYMQTFLQPQWIKIRSGVSILRM